MTTSEKILKAACAQQTGTRLLQPFGNVGAQARVGFFGHSKAQKCRVQPQLMSSKVTPRENRFFFGPNSTHVYQDHCYRVYSHSCRHDLDCCLIPSLWRKSSIKSQDANLDEEQSDQVLQLVDVPYLQGFDEEFWSKWLYRGISI